MQPNHLRTMKTAHTYEEFCRWYDQGKIKPAINSQLGHHSVAYLRNLGWRIRGGLFRRSITARDLLKICRQSAENFDLANKSAGIDFWLIEY